MTLVALRVKAGGEWICELCQHRNYLWAVLLAVTYSMYCYSV